MRKLDQEQAENMIEDWTDWMIENVHEPYGLEERGAELFISWLYGNKCHIVEEEVTDETT